MKAPPQVLAGVQEPTNLELSLSLQYLLDQRNVKRFGLSIADGLKTLHEQCESYAKDLAMVREILVAGISRNTTWESTSRLYRG